MDVKALEHFVRCWRIKFKRVIVEPAVIDIMAGNETAAKMIFERMARTEEVEKLEAAVNDSGDVDPDRYEIVSVDLVDGWPKRKKKESCDGREA